MLLLIRCRHHAVLGGEGRGVLGQGSVLLLTSIADRTSPVLRGKWILENILGTPPEPPPGDIPPLEASAADVRAFLLD